MVNAEDGCGDGVILSPSSSNGGPPMKKVCSENSSTANSNGMSPEFRPQVEVRLNKAVPKSSMEDQLDVLTTAIQTSKPVKNWKSFTLDPSKGEHQSLADKIVSISLGTMKVEDGADLSTYLHSLRLTSENVHLYKPSCDGPLAQEIGVESASDDTTVGSQLWNLPCIEFENIWENLIYDSNLKNDLMSYVYSLIHLSDLGANMKIINVNRLILLLGPPGTGKTSLCRGLSQHLSIRLNLRIPRSVMVEINSHSLFSKWFSESGKLIMRMFEQISELAEDRKCMVFVLIDEVESLGMSRESSSARGEPADSIRAVNALLTQIDAIRRKENVLILCTSNLNKCLDRAFLDRADLVRHVGQPSQAALYTILSECVVEMQRIGVVASSPRLCTDHSQLENEESQNLWKAAQEAIGLSGRSIRQIPALACSMAEQDVVSVLECVNLFSKAIERKRTIKEDE